MIVDCACIHCVETAFHDFSITEDRNSGSTMDKMKHIDQDDQDGKFKTRNLKAEKRRRKILGAKLFELRTLVPNITNFNRNNIFVITDAITYIEELRKSAEDLSDQLKQMEATSIDGEKTIPEEIDAEHEAKRRGIAQPEVQVNHLCGTQLRIKIVFQKKTGGLTKLMEAISVLGFDITDTSITTSRGAIVFTSSAEGIHGGKPDPNKIKKHLLEIIRSI